VEQKPRNCPDCDVPLHEVMARARSGYMIVLDQCERCGGIWCDRWELFPLGHEEAQRIDAVDTNKLYAPVAAQPREATRCPRCPVDLRPFQDPLLPADAQIRRCPLCEGMWLNRGALRRVKADTTRPPQPRSADVDALLRIYQDKTEPTWARVENLDSVLHAAPPEDDPEQVRKEVLASAGWVVLRFLLRLVLRV